MLLSIIVTHYQTPAVLKICLLAVKKSCQNIRGGYEIILSDSESIPETKEMIKEEFPEVVFIPFEKNVGYAKLVNAGLRKAGGNFILILNADIIPKENSIENLIEFLEDNPKVGMTGPQLLNFDDSPQPSAFRYYTPWTVICRRTFLGRTPWGKKEIERFLLKSQLARLPRPGAEATGGQATNNQQLKTGGVEVDWLMGSALMTRKEAAENVGLLDERFFMYFEDVDWARRFWENRYKIVYFPKSQMYHYHYKTSDKGRGIFDLFLNKQTRIHLLSALKYFWKYRHKNPKS